MNRRVRRIGSALVTAFGIGGGLALFNRWLLLDDLPPTLPGATHDWLWRGHRVRYTTLGSGPPVVLLHGIHAAASSFEMRQVFEPLSHTHTVYALDWLGFGKSERPPVRYDGHLYASLLADFLREVVQAPCVVVASSLSGAHAVTAAQAQPSSIERLVLLSPTFQTSVGTGGAFFGGLLALPLIGTAAFNVLVSHASIQSYLRKAYADTLQVDEPLVEQQWATAHQPNARLAPAAFVAGAFDLPVVGSPPLDVPILVLRGSVPGIGRLASDPELRDLGPRVIIETIPNAGQLPHDEAADRVLDRLANWTASGQ
jgi:pimeloyl-ACP methyl ester carboxylesterase